MSQAAFALAENISFSPDQKQFLNQFTEVYGKIARASNSKDVGIYDEVEILNGQKFFGATPQVKREAFRKVFNIGAIAAGATLATAHGLTNIAHFTRIYATVTTASSDYRPVPYVSVAAVNQGIEIKVDATNVTIINGSAAPNITSGIIILELLKS